VDRIDFNRPSIVGKELYYIAQAVLVNLKLSGNGQFTGRCQSWLERTLGCEKALLTHSCTAALEMAALLIDTKPGDEIIMPSYTFVSTANAFVLRGGVPVFVDIRPDTLNLDERQVERHVTDRTRAIVAVHYAGRPCRMDELMDICRRRDLLLVEDAAQALLSSYRGRPLGSFGDLACLSFHETKNVISGEGGALIINNPRFVDRAEVLWEKGTNRREFHRGQVDKYTWVDVGSSFLPGEMTAAFLYAQLEHARAMTDRRRDVVDRYRRRLEPLARAGRLRLGPPPDEQECNGHLFCLLTASVAERDRLLSFLAGRGVNAVFHYVPLHSSPAGLRYGRTDGELPVTDRVGETLVRLPVFWEITDEEIDRICTEVETFYAGQ
jgi:dTDP-4-amino-4,6-dideoxygalactose transaminase